MMFLLENGRRKPCSPAVLYYFTDYCTVAVPDNNGQDCDMFFRELGFDFIKVDYCGGLSVSVEGAATLLALDNGDHYTDDLFAGIAKKKMRGGKMQVILRSKREAGQVTVSAVSGNFKATYKTMTK